MSAKRQVVERVSGVRCQRVTRRVVAEEHRFYFGFHWLAGWCDSGGAPGGEAGEL